MERLSLAKIAQAEKPRRTSLSRRPLSETSSEANLRSLQRSMGNRALGMFLQAKLEVGPPGDQYEEEADRVAEHVMRMPTPAAATSSGGEELRRKCQECREEEESQGPMSRKVTGSASPSKISAPPIVHEVLRSPGRPLDKTTRAFFEPRFGRDFGQVRVHTDSHAAQSAAAVHALAYTVGNNLVFGTGQYAPDSAHGRRLLAHELTHVHQKQHANPHPQGPALTDLHPGLHGEPSPDRTSHHAAPELLQRQENPSPPPTPAQTPTPAPGQNPPQAPLPAANQVPPADEKKAASTEEKKPLEAKQEQPEAIKKDLKTRVRDWLDSEKFGLPLVLDTGGGAPEKWHAIYGEQRWTLEQIRDDTWSVLSQTDPEIKRGDVWQYVYQYYQEKERGLDSSSWQWVVQSLYTPSYTLWSSQPIGGSRWQNPLQATLGTTYAAHEQGCGGLEHQFSVTGSFLNLGSGQLDWFQNALAQYQLSAVTPLGKDFRVGDTWSYVQGSIYAQLAAGVGTSRVTPPGGERKAYVGFLFQPGAGGQITVNIGWFQLIVQGTVVYSYFSKTQEAASKPTHTLGFQPGVGIGGQF
jgi:hypothetical protein